MAHSTRGGESPKTRKPHKTSDTLTSRSDGRWCKKYKNGRREWQWWYFRGTELEAIDEWNTVKADLLAGRQPGSKTTGTLTLAELVNAFLHHKKQLLDSGEVAHITWQGYASVGKLLLEHCGRTRAAEHLQPMDFQRLRAFFAKDVGHVTLRNRINITRMIFKYGYKSKLLPKEADFGVDFDKPSAKTLRLDRARKAPRLFTP